MKKINNNLSWLQFQSNHILIAAFSILFGGIIYILLRPTPPVFFKTLSVFGLNEWLELLRGNTYVTSVEFPEWFVYSLPNGLWSFSYTLLIITIWRKHSSVIKYLWFATVPVLIFGFEFLQYFDLLRGTFSFPDVIAGFFGILAAITFEFLTTNTHNYEKNTT